MDSGTARRRASRNDQIQRYWCCDTSGSYLISVMLRESGASSNHRPTDGERLCLTRSCVATGSPGQGRAMTILGIKCCSHSTGSLKCIRSFRAGHRLRHVHSDAARKVTVAAAPSALRTACRVPQDSMRLRVSEVVAAGSVAISLLLVGMMPKIV